MTRTILILLGSAMGLLSAGSCLSAAPIAPLFYDCTGREANCWALFPGNPPTDTVDVQQVDGRLIVNGFDLGTEYSSGRGGYRVQLRRGNLLFGAHFGDDDADAEYAVWSLPNTTPTFMGGYGYDATILDVNAQGDFIGGGAFGYPFLYLNGVGHDVNRQHFETHSTPRPCCEHPWSGSGYDFVFEYDFSSRLLAINRHGQVLGRTFRYPVDADGLRTGPEEEATYLLSLNGGPAPVPEPATCALVGAVLVGALAVRAVR